MSEKRRQPTEPKTAAEVMPPLAEDSPLKQIAERVSPSEYGYASAREFAVGKHAQRKRRYALT